MALSSARPAIRMIVLLVIALLALFLTPPQDARAARGGPPGPVGQRSELVSLLRLPGGRLLVVGTTGRCVVASERPSCPPSQVLLVRLRPDGRLDPGFGRDGIVTTTVFPAGSVRVDAAVPTPEGGVILTGSTSASRGGFDASRLLLLRYLPDGDLDPGFGTGGMVATDLGRAGDAAGNAVALAPDGDILVAGSEAMPGQNPSFLLARFLPDGGPDPSFGEGGMAAGAFTGTFGASADALVPAADGGVVVAGGARTGSTEAAFAFARYLPDGRLDPGFGRAGTTTASPFRGEFVDATVGSLLVEADGGILALGSGGAGEHAVPRVELVRLGADGRIDPGLGRGGRLMLPFGGPERPRLAAARLLPDGDALLAGSEESELGASLRLGRFTAAGGPDRAFRPGAIRPPDGGHFFGGTALLGAGRGIILGATVRAARCLGSLPESGRPCRAIVLRRYRRDGRPARRFGARGTVLVPATRLCGRDGRGPRACRPRLAEAGAERTLSRTPVRP